jgi:DNA polymerase delta subunit 1
MLVADGRCKAPEPVLATELVMKENLVEWREGGRQPFLRVVVALPSLLSSCRRLLERSNPMPQLGPFIYDCFETNIDFDIRCLKSSF